MSGVKVSSLADGRKVLTGGTYPYKELIKAVGGTWNEPVERAWTVPASADISFLAPKKARVQRDVRGRCCSAAVASFDDENPQGPMIYCCTQHGSQKGSYCGT